MKLSIPRVALFGALLALAFVAQAAGLWVPRPRWRMPDYWA